MCCRIGIASFALFLAAIGLVAAQPATGAEEESRTWTSDDGKFTTEAAFAGFRAGKVTLRKVDGKTVDVPLGRLSEEDQIYVRKIAPDDPKSIDALDEQEAQLERDEEGRVTEVHFRPSSRISRRHVDLLAGLPNLQRLTLAQVRIGSGALDGIEVLSGLRQLDLTASGIGNPEVKQVTVLKNIEVLNLSDTQITNRALSYLKELPRLTELTLANTRIADNGIANLEELKQLKKLNLSNTRVSPQGILRLRKALPNTAMEGSGVVRR